VVGGFCKILGGTSWICEIESLSESARSVNDRVDTLAYHEKCWQQHWHERKCGLGICNLMVYDLLTIC